MVTGLLCSKRLSLVHLGMLNLQLYSCRYDAARLMTPPLDVTVTVARLDAESGHHVYACECAFTGAGPRWVVYRRFKQFALLREGAVRADTNVAKLEFPAKTPLRLRSHPQSLGSVRAVKLQAFLWQLVADAAPVAGEAGGSAGRAAHAAALKHFLGADSEKRQSVAAAFDQHFQLGASSDCVAARMQRGGKAGWGGSGSVDAPPLLRRRARRGVSLAFCLGCTAVATHWILRPRLRWLAQVLVVLHCVALLAGQ